MHGKNACVRLLYRSPKPSNCVQFNLYGRICHTEFANLTEQASSRLILNTRIAATSNRIKRLVSTKGMYALLEQRT